MSSPYDSLPGFDSPEAAARSTFPPQHVRVIASASNGRDGYVLLDTGPPGQPYLYGVCCHFRSGRWHEGSSSNGPGWSSTDDESGLGMFMHWNEAGPGVDCVRLELDGDGIEAPVSQGAFLAVWFDRPYSDGVGPRIVAYRQHGQWKAFEGWQWY